MHGTNMKTEPEYFDKLVKILNMKFHKKNASCGGGAVLCGGTGMARLRLIVALRSCFANEPNDGNCG